VSDRLTFNHGAAVTAWVEPDQPAAAATVPPPVIGPLRRIRPTLAFWGAWAFTFLLFIRPQETLPFLEPLHMSEIVAVGSLAALFLGRMSAGLPPVRLMPEIVGVFGLALVMVLTAPFSIWPGGAMKTFLDVYLKVGLIFLLLTHSTLSLDMLRRLNFVVLIAMGFLAFRGVFDYARGANVHEGRLWGAVEGLMGNPNDFAMNMVTFLPFALVVAFGREPFVRRMAASAIALAMLMVIAFTKSRAGMLGVVAMMAMLVFQAGKLRSSFMIAVVLGTLVAIPTAPPNIWTRMSSIANPEEDETGSREARKQLMLEGWRTFLLYPLTGVGVGQFKNYNPPERQEAWHETHNVVLQVLAELGIGGGVWFLFLMGCAVAALRRSSRMLRKDQWRRRKAGPWDVPAAFSAREQDRLRMQIVAGTAGFAGWFVCAQFASVGYYWTFYYLLAIIVITREIIRARMRDAERAAMAATRGAA
jgi:O-antigen ligase